jgi:hypothetical protein
MAKSQSATFHTQYDINITKRIRRRWVSYVRPVTRHQRNGPEMERSSTKLVLTYWSAWRHIQLDSNRHSHHTRRASLKRDPVFRVSFPSLSFPKVHRKFWTISKLKALRLRECELVCLYLYSHHYSLWQNFPKNTRFFHYCHFHNNTGGCHAAWVLRVYKTGGKKLALLPSSEQN